MVKPSFRTKSLSTKVSDEEFAQLEARAGGQTMSEWMREVLLRETEGQQVRPAEQTIVAEVVALRTILLNLLFKVTNGERITAEEMRQLIARADAEKYRKALERLGETNVPKQPSA